MLKRAGPDGMSKVVNEFTNNHPEISKRQTELKVFEVAVKEKQQDDTKQVKGKYFLYSRGDFFRAPTAAHPFASLQVPRNFPLPTHPSSESTSIQPGLAHPTRIRALPARR
jgi:hypothetical protein